MDTLWYGKHPLSWVLVPLSWPYRGITLLRRWFLQRVQVPCPVPLIVVGNLTVGGVGKTPLVIELANKMQRQGLKVGIVSRGFKAKVGVYPYEVQLSDSASLVGDEPLLLAEQTNCPVVIAPKRIAAMRYLLEKHSVDLIISDDGLQHYRMGRAIEIAVIDGMRGLGNGHCLPAGPLREPAKRLKEVDFIVVNEGDWPNAYPMHLIPGSITHLSSQQTVQADFFNQRVAAVAAIGNPQRFYSTLHELGIKFVEYVFPDHYEYQSSDLYCKEPYIIMTEKDAVKCRSFSSDKLYYLPIQAQLNDAFWKALWSHQQLKGYCSHDVN